MSFVSRFPRLGFAVLAAVTLQTSASAAADSNAAGTIVFGCPIALTGAVSKEGLLTKQGYDFWAAYVNAHGGVAVGSAHYTVKIRYVDDTSNPAETARAAQRLISTEHINFLLGPYGSAETSAEAAVAEKNSIPMVSSSGAAERAFNQSYRYLFGVQSPARKNLTGIIEFAIRRTPRPQTIAISSATDEFSVESQQGAIQSANDHGLRVVDVRQYAVDEPNEIAATAAAISARNPDIVLNAGHLQDAIALHRAFLKHGARAKIYGYAVGTDTPDFAAALGAGAQGVIGSAQWSPTVTYIGNPGFYETASEYARAFLESAGHAAEYHSAEASAAGVAFADAITAAKSIDPGLVRIALSKLNVMSFFGPIRFDSRGVNVYKQMVIDQIQGDRLVTIYPYRLANAAPIYPYHASIPVQAMKPISTTQTSGDFMTRDFRIETAHTESDLSDGSFTMPHPIRLTRPGVDIVGDRAHGNTHKDMVTIDGNVVFHFLDPSSRGQAAAPLTTLQCDELVFDARGDIFLASGDVLFSEGTRRASAAHGRFEAAAHSLVLTGNVRISDGEETLTAQTVRYDTRTNKVISNLSP